MRLPLWLTPFFSLAGHDEVPDVELETMPRSERFPPHPPTDDIPMDGYVIAERERQMHFYLYL